jgi:hypothetical protein
MTYMDEAIFISSIIIMTGLGLALSKLLIFKTVQFLSRWRQAGRKGYGFEERGLKRIRSAWKLFVEYDLWRD